MNECSYGASTPPVHIEFESFVSPMSKQNSANSRSHHLLPHNTEQLIVYAAPVIQIPLSSRCKEISERLKGIKKEKSALTTSINKPPKKQQQQQHEDPQQYVIITSFFSKTTLTLNALQTIFIVAGFFRRETLSIYYLYTWKRKKRVDIHKKKIMLNITKGLCHDDSIISIYF